MIPLPITLTQRKYRKIVHILIKMTIEQTSSSSFFTLKWENLDIVSKSNKWLLQRKLQTHMTNEHCTHKKYSSQSATIEGPQTLLYRLHTNSTAHNQNPNRSIVTISHLPTPSEWLMNHRKPTNSTMKVSKLRGDSFLKTTCTLPHPSSP